MKLDELLATESAKEIAAIQRQAPSGWEAGREWSGNAGTVVTRPLPKGTPVKEQEMLTEAGFDPAEYEIDGNVKHKEWDAQTPSGIQTLVSRGFNVKRVYASDIVDSDLEALVKKFSKVKRKPKAPLEDEERAFVICWADLQTGKTDKDGNTEDLVERVMTRLAGAEARYKELGCNAIYFLDLGDGCENTENVASQVSTNDLHFTEQVRVYRRLVIEAMNRLSRLTPKLVMAVVTSNHMQQRKNGKPVGHVHDDWGLEVMAQVQDVARANADAFGHVLFAFPRPYQESLALQIGGMNVGCVHGHHVTKPEGIPTWWTKQAYGRQPVADADLLFTGHFHHLRVQATGGQRWWIQAPTLDNGSSWFTNISGEESAPGLLTLTIEDGQWNDLKVL